MLDGSYGLAQAAHVHDYGANTYALTCAFFDYRKFGIDDIKLDLDQDKINIEIPVFIRSVSDDAAKNGQWPLVGTKPVRYRNVKLAEHLSNNHLYDDQLCVASLAQTFLEMYYGLRPWDGFYDSRMLDKLLLPHHDKPAWAKQKDAFSEEFLRRYGYIVNQKNPKKYAVTISDTENKISIQIELPHTGLPTVDELQVRQRLQQQLEKAGIGEILDSGGGEGLMDIHLVVRNRTKAIPTITNIVKNVFPTVVVQRMTQ